MNKYKLVLIFLFFGVLTMIITYPAILYLSGMLIGDGGENYFNFNFQYIFSQQLIRLSYPFSPTDILRYPVGFNFATGLDSLLATTTGGFLSLFLSNIPAYNVTILMLFSFNCFFSFLLFRYIAKSTFIGTLGAIIYGFSFFSIARSAGHLNTLFTGGFPFFVYALLRIRDSGFTTKTVLLACLAVLLILLSSFHSLLLFSIALLICLPFLLFFFPATIKLTGINRSSITKFLLILVPFFVIMITLIYPHIHAFSTGDFAKPARTSSDLLEYSPSIKDFFLPNNFLRLQIVEFSKNLNDSVKSIERVVFVGWVELLLFFLFIFFYQDKRLKYFIASVTLIFFILILGFVNPDTGIHLPYSLLHNFPPFSYSEIPARFFPIFYLFLAMGIILFLKEAFKSPKKASFFIFLIILIILERLPSNYWLSPTPVADAYIQAVKNEKSTAVLDIPVSYFNTVYDMLPYAYDKKIVSGSFYWFADTAKTRSFIEDNGLKRFMCGNDFEINDQTKVENRQLIQALKRNDIKTIVVHKNDLKDGARFYFPECAGARRQTSLLAPQLFMPNPTKEVQVMSLFFPAIPQAGDTIAFPSQGTFFINGFHISPIDWLPLHIYLNGAEIPVNQNWVDRGNKNATLDPYLRIDVRKGSRIRFQFDKNHNQDYSFVKLWYRYETQDKTEQVDSTGQIVKIYEDDDAAVFQIR